MKINTNMNVTFYQNSAVKEYEAAKKSVLLTDHRDVVKAVKEGTLTVDGVVLELSEEVRAAIQEASEQRKQDNEAVNMQNMLIHNANVAKQQQDAMEDTLATQAKAMEIARRIAKGGQVPPQDEQLLMEFSADMYQMAKQAAILAKEHEKYDTLVEEESGEQKNYDADEGKINTRYQVQVEVSMGEVPAVESVSEVAVRVNSV